MRRSAPVFSITLALLLTFLGTISTLTTNMALAQNLSDDSPKTFLLPRIDEQSNENSIAVIFDDSQSALGYASGLGDKDNNQNPDGTQSRNTKIYCKSLNDPTCGNTKSYKVYAILQPCKSVSEINCIDSVYAESQGKRIAGNFKENLPTTSPTDFSGDESAGLPRGGPPSIWQVPGVKNSGGSDLYTIIVSTRGESSRASATSTPTFTFNEYTTAIYPAGIKNGSFSLVTAEGSGNDAVTIGGCAANSEGVCAFRESFIMDGTAFGISIRFSKVPANWFYGRLSKQSISLTANPNGKGVILDVIGEPVKVPIVYGKSTWETLPSELQKIYSGSFPSIGNNYIEADKNKWKVTHIAASSDFPALKSWLSIVKDTAVAQTTQWYFKASPIGVDPKCNSNQLQVDGIVTSNATGFVPGPPQFNSQTQALDYQVSAPHFTAAGNAFKGTYDLAIRVDQAKCIYGFKGNFPVKATVSIISENGIEQIASENVGEKDGWLRLGAYNFSFSAPKLRVKLVQESPSEPLAQGGKESPTGSSQKTEMNNGAKSKSYKIKCAKGNKSFIQQGKNPACPKGYKLISRKAIN